MNRETEQKIAKIQELLAKKSEIEKELNTLLNPEPKAILPSGFSLNTEVLSIIKEVDKPFGITRQDIIANIGKKFPTYGINKKQIASSLAYLKNVKKDIDLIDRATYRSK